MSRVTVRIGPRPISVARAYRELEDPKSGAVALFVGRVRPDRLGGRTVAALLYEAHEAPARRALAQLERDARSRYRARRVLVWHRVGVLPVGTPSVLIGVAAAHRAEAFAACRHLIDALKATVPIWKTDRARPARRPRPRPGPRAGR